MNAPSSEKLSRRYQEFLKQAPIKSRNPLAFTFSYWSILKDDPQLPFELLPKNWLGSKAHQTFQQPTSIS